LGEDAKEDGIWLGVSHRSTGASPVGALGGGLRGW